MADVERSSAAEMAMAQSRPVASRQTKPATSFQQVMAKQIAARPMSRPPPAQPTGRQWDEAQGSLAAAMMRENVPSSWRSDLEYIMQIESGGRVAARNPIHSARGLFQLTRANYHYNPRGAASFGNGIEEAQGGIRYIIDRYGTPEAAIVHLQKNRWY